MMKGWRERKLYERAKNVERNPPADASLSKYSLNHDPNEQQLELKETRGGKRKVTREESNERQEKSIWIAPIL